VLKSSSRMSVLVVTALTAAGCSSSHHVASRKAAANFSLSDASGSALSLANYRGRVVLLNFWATWCGPCKVEIPWFIEFSKKYEGNGLTVVGVSMDDDGWKSVKPYITEKKMNYPVVIGNALLAKAYEDVDSLPTTFIIDRSGRIAFKHTGLVGRDTYDDEIRVLLNE
jgi:thiol-disulfide isomerase/thioredoxin